MCAACVCGWSRTRLPGCANRNAAVYLQRTKAQTNGILFSSEPTELPALTGEKNLKCLQGTKIELEAEKLGEKVFCSGFLGLH